jgi:nuclease HARBI1
MERRLPLRHLSWLQRPEGLDSLRMHQQRMYGFGGLLLFTLTAAIPYPAPKSIFLLLALSLMAKYYHATFGPRLGTRVLHHQNRRINSYDSATFRNYFRFEQQHALHVMSCLGLDPAREIICENRTKCNEEEAFLILLYRMGKHVDLVVMESEFGRDNTSLGRIIAHMVHLLVSNNHHLISNNIAFFVPRFKMYNAAIRRKFRGQQMPAAAIDTALFLDGTSLRIARPSGPHANQRNMYNGHHKVHCLQFQGVSAPDGMIVDFYGPLAGRRHDTHVLNSSFFNERLAQAQQGLPVQYKYYADKGYYAKSHGYAAYKGKNLPQLLVDENARMSGQRVGIEWTFGNIANRWAYVDFHKRQKIQMTFVGKYYWLAAILTNCHTCVCGSGPATRYWRVKPPTLAEYFGRNDIPI